tara:strand:+ start:543 stop:797 length:255 start_codon:yes stop_codon:yes gene_type:complete
MKVEYPVVISPPVMGCDDPVRVSEVFATKGSKSRSGAFLKGVDASSDVVRNACAHLDLGLDKGVELSNDVPAFRMLIFDSQCSC